MMTNKQSNIIAIAQIEEEGTDIVFKNYKCVAVKEQGNCFHYILECTNPADERPKIIVHCDTKLNWFQE
jgi:hypothetical protein